MESTEIDMDLWIIVRPNIWISDSANIIEKSWLNMKLPRFRLFSRFSHLWSRLKFFRKHHGKQ